MFFLPCGHTSKQTIFLPKTLFYEKQKNFKKQKLDSNFSAPITLRSTLIKKISVKKVVLCVKKSIQKNSEKLTTYSDSSTPITLRSTLMKNVTKRCFFNPADTQAIKQTICSCKTLLFEKENKLIRLYSS